MRTLIAAVAAALLLAGCGAPSAKPKPLDTPSASASSAASATPKTPQMPAEAKQKTKAGAEAFVRYFLKVANVAATSGDTRELTAHSSPNCESCRNLRNAIEKLYVGGGRLEGGDVVPRSVLVPAGGLFRGGATVDVQGEYAAQTTHESGGKVVKSPGGPATLTYMLKESGSGWLVDSYTSAR